MMRRKYEFSVECYAATDEAGALLYRLTLPQAGEMLEGLPEELIKPALDVLAARLGYQCSEAFSEFFPMMGATISLYEALPEDMRPGFISDLMAVFAKEQAADSARGRH